MSPAAEEALDVVLVLVPGTTPAQVRAAFEAAGAAPDPAAAPEPGGGVTGWLLDDRLPATVEAWPLADTVALDVSLWPPAARAALAERLPLVPPHLAGRLLEDDVDPRRVALGARLAEATGQVDLAAACGDASDRPLPPPVAAEVAALARRLASARAARDTLREQTALLTALFRTALASGTTRPAAPGDVPAVFVRELWPAPPSPPPAPAAPTAADEPYALAPAGLLRRPPPMGPAVARPWRDVAHLLVPNRVWAIPARLDGPAYVWLADRWVAWPQPWASVGAPR